MSNNGTVNNYGMRSVFFLTSFFASLALVMAVLFGFLGQTHVEARTESPTSSSSSSSKQSDSGSLIGNNCSDKDTEKCLENNSIIKLLRLIITFLTAGVGVVVVVMITIGGLQYIKAGDNSSEVAAAKQKIFNAIFALICFGFLFAFVQWLVPGGVFR